MGRQFVWNFMKMVYCRELNTKSQHGKGKRPAKMPHKEET